MSTDLGQQMQQLYSDFGELPGITIELHQQLLAIRVDNNEASATVFLQGAQITDFQTKGCKPLIWCSDQSDYKPGVPLRGGIPICWPWFGELAMNAVEVKQQIADGGSDPQLPAHGFVRHLPWQLSAIDTTDNHATQLVFKLILDGTEHPHWSLPAELTYTVTVGNKLSLQLSVNNTGNQPINFSSALHTYYAIDAIENIAIHGLEKCNYIDCMDDWQEKAQRGQLCVDREVDRIYHGDTGHITIAEKNQRDVIIASRGSRSAVIWNPWIEKSSRLSHFPDHAYKKMLCVETANADRDFVALSPKQTHTLAVTIHSTSS